MSERRFGNELAPRSDAKEQDSTPAPEGPLASLVERFGQAGARRIIQRRLSQRADGKEGGGDDAAMQAAADRGLSGAGGPLPHADAIQQSFGRHDISGVQAHTDGAAAEGAAAMNAEAFATGSQVAFAGGAPSLHTAAHEAAHVVQQQAGVQLKRDDGAEGGAYEQHADAVADRVVRGESAEKLLDQVAPGGARGGGGAAAGGGGVQRKIKSSTGYVLGVRDVDEVMRYIQRAGDVDLARAKEIALELLSTARVIPLQEAVLMIRERARAGGGAGAGAAAPASPASASPAQGAAAQGAAPQVPQASAASAAPAPRAEPVSARPGNLAQSAGGDRQTTGPEARDQRLTPAERQRGAEGAAAKDLGPMLMEVRGLLGEIKAIKANVPWGTTRIRVHRAIEAFDGLLNVAVGAVAIAGDFATMGMATPIMGGVVLAKDAAFSTAREHLAGGGVSGEPAAQATATNVAVPQVKAMIGPVTAGGVNLVPLAGGALMAGKGAKQLYGAVTGELPPGAAGDPIVFEDIRTCRSSASGIMEALRAKQAVLRDPGLADVIGQIAEFLEWLDRQEAKARKRFIKRAAKTPPKGGRLRGGEHSELPTAAALKASAGEAGKWARFKSAVGGSESTYLQILSLLEKHEGLATKQGADATGPRIENAQKIYELSLKWLEGHESEKETPKYRAIAQLKALARDEAMSLKQAEAAGGADASAAAPAPDGAAGDGDGDDDGAA